MALAGGTGESKPADAEIQAMVDELRSTAQEKAHAKGWNGVFERWEAKDVKTQVVAGTNYFVKVAISDKECVHLRIFKPLPHTRKPAELHSLKLGQDHATEVTYFADSDP
eukprot:CAMPEP_0115615490 /NCGR_PEP_ID=MMETSP0272-20121206/22648_1 /TAXON_ID=71861 /ORGANISM="Scrippsiella trochoidea, Strain CCMP3099" /LENGTH=109 /DNA_ID=CAMNT_0003051401 /DNA_START=47 /DNA_END=376 /DNA_ORIENTATION=-